MEAINGSLVRLRKVTETDTEPIRHILTTEEVSRWWGDPETELRSLLDPDDDTDVFVIEFDGRVAGIIQAWEESDPDFRHAGIDLAVHPDWHRRGLGGDAIHALARHLIDVRGHHRLVIDPSAANENAIRLYRQLGFRPVGTLRRYQRLRDGRWHDGLLLDLLADELTPPGRPPAPDRVEAEIREQHRILAGWLGSGAGPDVLDTLRDSHSPDFTIVATDGRVLALGDLLDGLAQARNALPGLRIDIQDVHTLARTPEFVVARFTETHTRDGLVTRRRVTAVLETHPGSRNGLRWRSVHETTVSS